MSEQQNPMTFEQFRESKRPMTLREMADEKIEFPYLEQIMDAKGQLLDHIDGSRQCLVYPCHLVIEVLPPDAPQRAEGKHYYLMIHNNEWLGTPQDLPELERELYEFARDEGMV